MHLDATSGRHGRAFKGVGVRVWRQEGINPAAGAASAGREGAERLLPARNFRATSPRMLRKQLMLVQKMRSHDKYYE